MAYCTNAHVASEFKDITFSSSTKVTDTEVDRFIEEADAFIDGMIGKRYSTPVTGSNSLIILRQISIDLVARRVKKIMNVKTGTAAEEQAGAGPTALTPEERLEKIANNEIVLSDATLLNSKRGIASYVSTNSIEHIFDAETDQW